MIDYKQTNLIHLSIALFTGSSSKINPQFHSIRAQASSIQYIGLGLAAIAICPGSSTITILYDKQARASRL